MMALAFITRGKGNGVKNRRMLNKRYFPRAVVSKKTGNFNAKNGARHQRIASDYLSL
ncbi:MAG TPA: hypothetical protein PKM50_03945 [Methanoregula sp.]|nr:hypothetical protein [Methanoregula sp.]